MIYNTWLEDMEELAVDGNSCKVNVTIEVDKNPLEIKQPLTRMNRFLGDFSSFSNKIENLRHNL